MEAGFAGLVREESFELTCLANDLRFDRACLKTFGEGVQLRK